MLNSVLVIGAHPDDETMLAGGTLALLSQQNVQVYILCATRGEGGELGEPPLCEREELGAMREHELRCAATELGAAYVYLLDYVDPLIGPDDELYPFHADYNTLIGQINDILRTTGVDLIITHGSDGEYGHPAHKLLHRATKEAVKANGVTTTMYSFAATVPGMEDRIWNKSDAAHLALDIRPWLDVKEAAALCHQTQNALFKRRSKAETVREILRTTEGFHRHSPPSNGMPDDPFAELLLAAGAWIPGA